MNTEQFYKLPKDLAKADGYISKTTGEVLKLSSSAKIIYTYMLSQNEFFTATLKGQHFETQTTIATACGLEAKAVGTILRSFLDNGVMTGKKLKPDNGGQWRWYYYKVLTDLVLWQGSVEKYEIIKQEVPIPVEKVVPKTTISKKTPVYQPQDDWDENLPF